MKLKDLIKEDFPEAIIPELMISLQIDDRIQKFHNSGDIKKRDKLENIKNKLIKQFAQKTKELSKKLTI